ncbi:MAG: OmpH family outer membrane protein [Rhodospirillales bacterium]|nr:OmpH family outer membrane protein [Rhodospirillales bacterium]
MMRRAFLGAALVITATALYRPVAALADASSNVRIAVLDVDRVRRESAAVKAIRAQLGGYLDVYRTETQKEEQEIRAGQEELARKRSDLSADGYAEARKKLEDRLLEAQERVQHRRQALERVNTEAMEQVKQALEAIVIEIADERQLGLIVRKDQAVYAATSLEITNEVLERLDRRLPKVQISDPGG